MSLCVHPSIEQASNKEVLLFMRPFGPKAQLTGLHGVAV